MGLLKPAWMSKDINKAMNAVSKISDQRKLAEIVGTSEIYFDFGYTIREAALNKITDQHILYEVAKKVKSEKRLFNMVVNKVSDPKILEEIRALSGEMYGIGFLSYKHTTAKEKEESSKRYAEIKQRNDREHYEGGGH